MGPMIKVNLEKCIQAWIGNNLLPYTFICLSLSTLFCEKELWTQSVLVIWNNFLLTFFVKRRRASCVRLKSVSSFTTWTKFVQIFSWYKNTRHKLFNDQRGSCQNFRLLALEYDEIKYPEKKSNISVKVQQFCQSGFLSHFGRESSTDLFGSG